MKRVNQSPGYEPFLTKVSSLFLSLDSSRDSSQFVHRVKPLVCHKETNLSATLFRPKLGT